jgi:hypothetical protein
VSRDSRLSSFMFAESSILISNLSGFASAAGAASPRQLQ